MTARDWATGTAMAVALWAFAVLFVRRSARQRRARDRREMRRSASRWTGAR